jgi:hypothetical protein
MTLSTFALIFGYAINIANFFWIVVFPHVQIFRLGYALRKRGDEIRFEIDTEYDIPDKDDPETDDTAISVDFIIATFWLTENCFFEWKMTENGDILDYLPNSPSRKWIYKTRVQYWRRRRPKEKRDLLRYRYVRSHTTRFFMGWVIRRYTAEPFTMAKLTGFEKYDYMNRIDPNR